MRLAISNIAWDAAEDSDVAAFLQNHRIDAIDVAPGKYFPDPKSAKEAEIAAVKTWWSDHGIEVTGMQSLLFGTTGLNLFSGPESQAAMLDHLQAVCRIGAGLGATRLVFGSPKNRDRSGLSDADAHEVAVAFFQRLGDVAAENGVIICLEPNPPVYGANFMTTSDETATIVRAVGHDAIRMQFDSGALAINQENPTSMLQDHGDLIGHIHASEPDLVPLGDGGVDHLQIAMALSHYLPDHIVSIEMLTTSPEPHLAAIERALTCANKNYRPIDNAAR